jgi:hypothetical protein
MWNADTMGERMERIGQIRTDVLSLRLISNKNFKKIRSNPPNPLHPFSHRIGIPHSEIQNPKSFCFFQLKS